MSPRVMATSARVGAHRSDALIVRSQVEDDIVANSQGDDDAVANISRKVARTDAEWSRSGDYIVVTATIPALTHNMYVRVRGTDSSELEPLDDGRDEDPWTDLWFYSNPIFLAVR